MADDAVAEAFTQALARGDALREPLAWIWRVAFRVAAGELKDRRRRFGEPREQASEFPDQLVDLFRALSRLSPTQRAAVVLHHYAGYQVREIAHILGSTPPAVRVHLSVGRKRVRSLLEDDDD